jgi:hypothetical protein
MAKKVGLYEQLLAVRRPAGAAMSQHRSGASLAGAPDAWPRRPSLPRATYRLQRLRAHAA